MKKRSLQIFCAALFTLMHSVSVAQTAVQPMGSGTAEDPYKVETLNNLYWITQNSSSWDKCFKQTAQIDATATSGWDGGAGLLPIGTYNDPFTGEYNGQGGTITMLYISRPGLSCVGLFGVLSGGKVKNLGLQTSVVIGNNYVGAIAGLVLDTAVIERCFVSCVPGFPITGNKFVGGIAGSLDDGSVILESSSVTEVTGNSCVGGLVGRNLSSISNCYAAGPVNGLVSQEGGIAGALIAPSVTNSFWDTDASGLMTSNGGTGKTTSEMQSMSTYTDLATTGLSTPWDFVGIPYDDSGIADLWNMDTTGALGFGYPIPSWMAPPLQPSGSGTQADPWLIENLFHLYWLSETPASWATGTYIEQTNDIYAYSTAYINFGWGWEDIAAYNSYYYGCYNGQGHEIRGITIRDPEGSDLSSRGFFGGMENATLTGLHLTDMDYSSTRTIVGGLAGLVRGSTLISKCSCQGVIQTTSSNVGLLVGQAAGGVIEECRTLGSVSGSDRIGGLLGATSAFQFGDLSISNCYSTADVTGIVGQAGGLAGSINPITNTCFVHIENSYSSGSVTGTVNTGGFIGYIKPEFTLFTATSCFWDTETSGWTDGVGNLDPDPPGIEGKTTAEMKTESTFTNAGWDFTNIWAMDPAQVINDGYPYFIWMNTAKTLDIKVFLEGPFNGTDMNTDVYGSLPLTQPYNTAPWNYTGTKAVAAIPNTDVVDWILVELRDAPDAPSATSATIVARQACFLLKNGSVVEMDGYSLPLFTYSPIHSLFAVLWHRNHLAVMSAVPLTDTGSAYSYDFSTSASQAYGGIQGHTEIAPGIWGMIGADGNADGQINNGDKIDVWSVQAGTGDYKSGDFNLDAQVNNGDKNDVWVPNTGLGGQVPQ